MYKRPKIEINQNEAEVVLTEEDENSVQEEETEDIVDLVYYKGLE